MDINDLGKLLDNKQPFSVRVVRDVNWRHSVQICVYVSIPVAPRGEIPIETTFGFTHPALFSLPTTVRIFENAGIPYELDDRLAGAVSTSPEPVSPAEQHQRPCKICGKTSFKTSRRCMNPTQPINGNLWSCLLMGPA